MLFRQEEPLGWGCRRGSSRAGSILDAIPPVTKTLPAGGNDWTAGCLADAGIEPSVGGSGDSHDNARAQSVIGLFKTEVIPRRDP